MDRVPVRFARFLSPGSFTAETWERPVDSLDPAAVPFPDNAYAFTLHERVDVHDGPEVFTGKERQVGPTYYHPDSKVETLDEVRANPNATRILVSNMEINRWDRLIWTRWGNWPQPFDPANTQIVSQ